MRKLAHALLFIGMIIVALASHYVIESWWLFAVANLLIGGYVATRLLEWQVNDELEKYRLRDKVRQEALTLSSKENQRLRAALHELEGDAA